MIINVQRRTKIDCTQNLVIAR